MQKILINHKQLIELLRTGKSENVKSQGFDVVDGEEYEDGEVVHIERIEVV